MQTFVCTDRLQIRCLLLDVLMILSAYPYIRVTTINSRNLQLNETDELDHFCNS